jgi:hypothetical protein
MARAHAELATALAEREAALDAAKAQCAGSASEAAQLRTLIAEERERAGVAAGAVSAEANAKVRAAREELEALDRVVAELRAQLDLKRAGGSAADAARAAASALRLASEEGAVVGSLREALAAAARRRDEADEEAATALRRQRRVEAELDAERARARTALADAERDADNCRRQAAGTARDAATPRNAAPGHERRRPLSPTRARSQSSRRDPRAPAPPDRRAPQTPRARATPSLQSLSRSSRRSPTLRRRSSGRSRRSRPRSGTRRCTAHSARTLALRRLLARSRAVVVASTCCHAAGRASRRSQELQLQKAFSARDTAEAEVRELRGLAASQAELAEQYASEARREQLHHRELVDSLSADNDQLRVLLNRPRSAAHRDELLAARASEVQRLRAELAQLQSRTSDAERRADLASGENTTAMAMIHRAQLLLAV